MLEKIGLPPKPSLRGNNWVVDASHCQGCSSHFTFINRKHHCRRCGGLFCNSCTQLRMVLRGQGDSPVRICEPCKKLEEAARFEMRNGNKNRAGRGGSKLTSKYEEEFLSNQIMGNEGKDSISSARASTMDMLSSALRTTSDASCSNSGEGSTGDGQILKSLSLDQHNLTDIGSTTPEELRQQAIEEKKNYKTLKAEGKSEEALKAFKRGKELERQAGALELYLRKNRKKALASGKDDSGTSGRRNKISLPKSEGKDDLAYELKELGWSDMDLRDAEKRPATLSVEGELSTLLGEVSRKTNTEKRTHAPDKSQVIAHKKKALELKRAGNLAEAKEELKKAKVLEKQIEEQELLGEAEDSDEELSSLIRSIDDYKDDDLSIGYDPHSTFDFDLQLGTADDLGVNDNFEVEDEDMDDPEIAAALKSLGWTEETAQIEDISSCPASIDKEALMNEIHSLKKEALNKKRAGNTAEAMALLKKAKGLEMDLDSSDSLGTNDLTAQGSVMTKKGSASQLVEKASGFGTVDVGDVDEVKVLGTKLPTKSKLMIQKELLGLKKRALALRREGKLAEAEEELEKGKVLEKQLEEIDKAPKAMQLSINNKPTNNTTATDPADEDDVTDQDMHDPTYVSLLKNLGWKDDNDESLPSTSSIEIESSADISGLSATQATANFSTGVSRKSKGEIQRELLGLKRKSLALRRQGDVDEAEEVLKMAKLLEAQLAEIETPLQKEVSAELESDIKDNVRIDSSLKNANLPFLSDSEKRPREDLGNRDNTRPKNSNEMANGIENPFNLASNSTQTTDSQNNQSTLQDDILAHKRKAVILKREGKLAEAKEELRKAKHLEKQLEEKAQPSNSSPDVPDSKVSSVGRKEDSSNLAKKPLTARDRFKLQQESLSHKRQALKLRREGRTEEADAEFELAKALEAQLEELAAHDSVSSSETVGEQIDDVSVEDFLDPQLASALKALGIPEATAGRQGLQGPVSKISVVGKVDSSTEERMQLEEQIKVEKLKALNLKRSGKQAEALDALRRAKHFEKKLNSLSS